MIEEEVEILEPEQEQQNPDPPKRKLWKGLMDKKLYTKSYEDFEKQFSTPESINKLYSNMYDKGLYSKSDKEFNSQFFTDTGKKKVASVDYEGSSLQAGNSLSQLSGEVGADIPTIEMYTTPSGEMVETDPVSISHKYNQLIERQKSKDSNVGQTITDIKLVPDDGDLKSAKKLKEDFPDVDMDGIYDDTKGLSEELLNKYKTEILPDRDSNNELYQRKLAHVKWRKGYETSINEHLDKGYINQDEHDILLRTANKLTEATSQGDFTNQREAVRSMSKAIQLYGGENNDEILKNFAVEVSKVYGNAYNNKSEKTFTDTPESKYFDKGEQLALNFLEDVAPEKAEQYKRLMIDEASLKDKPDEKYAFDHLHQTLKETAIGLEQNSVSEELKSLNKTAEAQGGLDEQQLKRADELEKKNKELADKRIELDKQYPDRVTNKVDDGMQEIFGQNLDWGDYAKYSTVRAFKNTAQGIWEAVSAPVMSDESNSMRELAIMGEGLKEETFFHKTDKNKGVQYDKMVFDPELKAKIDAIYNDKNLDDKQKKSIIGEYLKNNPDKFGRVPIHNGKYNLNPASLLFGLTDLGTAILPFVAIEAATGGIGGAGAAAKFIRTFTAAAATTIHDEYSAALLEGKTGSDAYRSAMAKTAINSFAMAGAGTPAELRAMAKGNSSAEKLIRSMSDDAIQKQLDKGIAKGLKPLAQSLKERAKAIPSMVGKGLKAGAKFEGYMAGANAINGREVNQKQMILNVANFGILGAALGHLGYKSPTELQKSAGYEFAKNPKEYEAVAREMHKDGFLSNEELNHRITLIEQYGEAFKTLPKANAKGEPLTENQKAEYLYNNIIKNEGNKGKSNLPPKQAEKAEHSALVADHKNDLILEPKTIEKLESTKIKLENQLEKKDENGKSELTDTEIKEVKAELEAIDSAIENKSKEPKGEPENITKPIELSTTPIEVKGKDLPEVETHESVMKRAKTGEPIEVDALRIQKSDDTNKDTGVFFADKGIIEEYQKREESGFYGEENKGLFGGDVHKYNLKFENPLVIGSQVEFIQKLAKEGDKEAREVLPDWEKEYPLFTNHETWADRDKFVAKKAREIGHDGIITPLEYIALGEKSFSKQSLKVSEEAKPETKVPDTKEKTVVAEAEPNTGVPKTGKFEEKARKIADKINEAELPSWLKIDDTNVNTKGASAEQIKKALADATIKMGKLLDKGVEFGEAVKEAVRDLVGLMGEGMRDKIEEGFSKDYKNETNHELSGIKKALVSEKVIEGVDLERVSDKEMMALGRKILDTGEVKPEALVTKIITDGKGVLTPTEVVGLITYKRDMDSALQDTYKQLAERRANGEDIGTLGVEAKNLERQINDFDVMAVITAQQQSMAFRLRQRMLDREYNVVTQIAKYKANNNGEISAEIEAKFRDLDKQLKEVKAKLVEAEKKVSDKEAQDAVDNIKDSVGREKKYTEEELQDELKKERAKLRVEKKSSVHKAIDETMAKWAKKITPDHLKGTNTKGVDAEGVFKSVGAVMKKAYDAGEAVTKIVEDAVNYISEKLGNKDWGIEEFKKENWEEKLKASTEKKAKDKPTINEDGTVSIPNDMLRDLVKRGVTDINDLTKDIHEQVKKELPDITERQVRDYITDYGKKVNPTADEIQTQVNTAKRVGRLLSELEDVQNKIKKNKGSSNPKLTDKERELKRQINALIKDTFGKEEKSNEQKLIDAKQRTKDRIDELTRKIKNKDFAKPVKKLPVTDTELVKLNTEKEKLQDGFDKEQYALQIKNRTVWQKWEDRAYEATSGLMRGLTLGVDLSAAGVQGMRRLFTNPKRSGIAFWEGLKHLVSEKGANDFLEKQKSQPYYPLLRASKLAIDDKSGKQSVKEGMFVSEWINFIWNKAIAPVAGLGTKWGTNFVRKINPYAASQRAYDGYVNSIRIQTYLKLAKELSRDGYTYEADPKVFNKLADFVNTTTGRGSLGAADANSRWLNVFLTAPRKVISEVKLYTPYAFVYYAKMPKPVRMKALKDFAQFTATFMAVNALVWASRKDWGNDEEDKKDNFWNMNSSDFLTHKFGNKRLSIGGGMKSILTMQSRFWSGNFTDQYGNTSKLGDRFGKPINTRLDLVTRFSIGKAAPIFNVAAKKLDERAGRPVENEELIKNISVPLWIQDIGELYKNDPNSVAPLLMVFSILGANVRSVEEKNDSAEKPTKKQLPKKQMKKTQN